MEEEKYKKYQSKPGFIAKLSTTDRPPIFKEGIRFPAEIVQLLELSKIHLSEIMNIHPEPVGANDSGIALARKEKMKLQGNGFLFDNLSFAKRQVVKIVLYLMQKHYTVERIMRIIAKTATSNKEAQIDGKPIMEYNPEDVRTFLENKDLTKLDIIISEGQWTPTMRMANLMILLELAKTRPDVPVEVLIEFMDQMPKSIKERLIKGIEQARAAAQQADLLKNQ